jgi:hypothetical protein
MRIKIRDWDTHFEADRSRQWKKLSWVPVPNKQGLGYKKIMHQQNGAEIFGCWNSLVQQASLCSPRGDLSKYSIEDLSTNTMIPLNILTKSITFIIQTLDWIEVIEEKNTNLDKNVNECHQTGHDPDSSGILLCSSIPSSSLSEGVQGEREKMFRADVDTFLEYPDTMREKFIRYWTEPNKSKTKMRFQLEKTWDTKRRLETWASRDKSFSPVSDREQKQAGQYQQPAQPLPILDIFGDMKNG